MALINVPSTLAVQQGLTDYGSYPFVNVNGSNQLPASTSPTRVTVVLENSRVVSFTATRPAAPPFDVDYKCRGTSCNGVTVSNPTINNDLGFPVQVRTITLNATRLSPVNADGSLSSSTPATLSGTLTGAFYANADVNGGIPVTPIPEASCQPFTQKAIWKSQDEADAYGVCPEIFGGPSPFAETLPRQAGGVRIALPPVVPNTDPSQDSFVVLTNASGAVEQAVFIRGIFTSVDFGENYGCRAPCTGVSVSAPNGAGNRQVTITNATFNIIEADGFPTGARTAIVNGSFTAPAPPPGATPVSEPARAATAGLAGKR